MKGKQIVNFLAYFAIALIAVVLVVGTIIGKFINQNILDLLSLIAQTIAYVITAVYGFSFAKNKKNIGWLVAYIIFVVLIVVAIGWNGANIINALKK